MRGRLDGDKLRGGLNAHVSANEIGDVREFRVQHLAPQLTQVQVHVVFPADAAAFLQFAIDGARDHVARSEVQEARRVTLHEALAVLIAKDSPLAARSFAQQDPELIDAGGMKLKKFHVLERNAAPERHGHAVPGERQSVRGNAVDATAAAGREQDRLGVKGVEFAGGQRHRDHARRAAVFNQQVEQMELVVEVDFVLDTLLVERLEDHVAGAVGGVAGAAHRRFAVIARVPAERPLSDLPFRRAAERQAPVLELVNRFDGFAAKDFDRVLVGQIVAALDRVKHVPFPVVFFEVAKRGADAALRGAGMGTDGIEFGDDRDASLG